MTSAPNLSFAICGATEAVKFFTEKGVRQNKLLLNEEILISTASQNSLDLIQYCLEKGIKVNQAALFIAIFKDNDQMAKFLLMHDKEFRLNATTQKVILSPLRFTRINLNLLNYLFKGFLKMKKKKELKSAQLH